MSKIDDFIFLEKIGKGSYSSVYRVKRKNDKEEYALKKVSMAALKDKEKENALNEVRILASINHPCMISFKDCFFDAKSNSLCIVMEYADQGDLQSKVDYAVKTKKVIPEGEIWKIIYSILRGLKQLHNRNILHRDIKSANIFISKTMGYKLGDLNVSKMAKQGLVYTQTGTPYYAAPEVWRDEPYSMSSDIWSLGCLIYELATLKPPFRAHDMEGLYKKVQKGAFDRIGPRYSNDLMKFITLCMKREPKERPTCSQLLESNFLVKNVQKSQNEQPENNELVEEDMGLLQTIKVPKNLGQLVNKLPKSQYVMNKSFDQEIISRTNTSQPTQSKPISKTPIQTQTKHQKITQQQQQQQFDQQIRQFQQQSQPENEKKLTPLPPKQQQNEQSFDPYKNNYDPKSNLQKEEENLKQMKNAYKQNFDPSQILGNSKDNQKQQPSHKRENSNVLPDIEKRRISSHATRRENSKTIPVRDLKQNGNHQNGNIYSNEPSINQGALPAVNRVKDSIDNLPLIHNKNIRNNYHYKGQQLSQPTDSGSYGQPGYSLHSQPSIDNQIKNKRYMQQYRNQNETMQSLESQLQRKLMTNNAKNLQAKAKQGELDNMDVSPAPKHMTPQPIYNKANNQYNRPVWWG